MAVITDLVPNLADIHPNQKSEVGRRLALWALAKTYGQDKLVYSGPLYKSAAITGNKIRDHFRRRQAEPQAQGGSTAMEQLSQLPEAIIQAEPCQTEAEIGHLFRQATELVRSEFEPNTWQAFWQVAIEGRVAADVAADLGISVQAVYDAKYRLRRRIRQELSDLIE